MVHTLTTYQDELNQALDREEHPDLPSTAPSASAGQELPITPAATGTDVPVPDSGSMSLTSSSTASQNTLAPPFPPTAGTMIDHYASSATFFGLRPYALPLYIRALISCFLSLFLFLFFSFSHCLAFVALHTHPFLSVRSHWLPPPVSFFIPFCRQDNDPVDTHYVERRPSTF